MFVGSFGPRDPRLDTRIWSTQASRGAACLSWRCEMAAQEAFVVG